MSHIDIAPSLLALAGADSTRSSEIAGRDLPGKDFSSVLGGPGTAGVHALRESVLFTYSGIASNDGDLMGFIANAKAAGKDPKAEMAATGFRPNLKKRGSVRSMFVGSTFRATSRRPSTTGRRISTSSIHTTTSSSTIE